MFIYNIVPQYFVVQHAKKRHNFLPFYFFVSLGASSVSQHIVRQIAMFIPDMSPTTYNINRKGQARQRQPQKCLPNNMLSIDRGLFALTIKKNFQFPNTVNQFLCYLLLLFIYSDSYQNMGSGKSQERVKINLLAGETWLRANANFKHVGQLAVAIFNFQIE